MKRLIIAASILCLCKIGIAGLPPTSTQGSADATPVPTFFLNYPNTPITHSGVTAFIPASSTPLDSVGPLSVGSSNTVGVSTSASRQDHVHQGVHSNSITGSAQLYSDVVFNAGSGIALGQTGQIITITNTAQNNGLSLTSTTPLSVGGSNVVGISTSAARADHVHQGVHSINASGSPALFSDITFTAGSNITLGQSGQVVTISGSSSSGSSSGGVIKFEQSGGISVMTDFGNPHRFAQAATLQTVSASMYDSGLAGNTVFQVNQWRSGVTITAVTGTIPSNNGLAFSGPITLSGSLSFVTDDMMTLDLISIPSGTPQDLTVEVDSGALAGPTGPAGAGAVPNISGSANAPNSITAVGGVAFSGANYSNITYVSGSGGPVTVTANPRIAACTSGQALTIIGESATNTVTLQDGNGLSLNGTWVGGLNSILGLVCDTNLLWLEAYRR